MNEEESKAGIQEEAMTAEAEEAATAAEETAAEEKNAAKTAKDYKRVPDFLEPYLRRYSGEKVFHVTSDRQVFLDKNHHLARLHQQSLGKGKLKTYNI